MAHRHRRIETYIPHGRPSKAYRHILSLAGIKKEIKHDIEEEIKRGRPKAPKFSLTVLGGKLRVKEAKSRAVHIGKKTLVVD